MAKANTAEPANIDPADLDDADALFGEGGHVDDLGDEEFGAAEDLLDEVDEDDAEGWNPAERGESISGVVVKIGETRSDFAQKGEDPMVPTVTIQNRDGKFRVIGFASVLRKELAAGIDNGTIKVGNLFAAKYWGDKPIKRGPFAGKTYRHYTVVGQAPKAKVKG